MTERDWTRRTLVTRLREKAQQRLDTGHPEVAAALLDVACVFMDMTAGDAMRSNRDRDFEPPTSDD